MRLGSYEDCVVIFFIWFLLAGSNNVTMIASLNLTALLVAFAIFAALFWVDPRGGGGVKEDGSTSLSLFAEDPTTKARQRATSTNAAIAHRSTSTPEASHTNTSANTVFHILPHSHCDAAYKKTFDEYYETEVRNVLNSMSVALERDKSRRFVWAETIYLTRWWKDPRTTDQQKKLFHELLILGRLEIVNGGWVMHDEGITRYDSQIHQMTEGHDRLKQMLFDHLRRPNVSVTTGWQIDPFGPSPFTVNLHDWAGMDFLVLNRMPSNVKDALKANQTLQFYWDTGQAKIFVHVMDTHYASPHGFDWEDMEHGDPIPITKENVRERSDIFMKVLSERLAYYRTPHVLIPMGGDFTFQNASMQFRNMERIFHYVTGHPDRYGNATFRYSTPKEYQNAVMDGFLKSKQQSIPVIHGGVEFQPLLAGYYFQLPNLKQMLRTCEVVLRTVEVRLCQTSLFRNAPWSHVSYWVEEARKARETMGLMQHHDAITATSYRFVIADYMQRLAATFRQMTRLLSEIERADDSKEDDSRSCHHSVAGKILGGGPYIHETVLVRDAQTARSVSVDKILSPQMGFDGITLLVLNSLSQSTTSLVHFVCTRDDVAISRVREDGSLEPVQSQATPLDQEMEAANLGLFLITFEASVPGLWKARYNVQVCDLTWNTFQDPVHIPTLECSHKALPFDSIQLGQNGLTSERLKIGFNKSTLEIDSMTSIRKDGTELTSSLDHDFILYYGGNDTIYEFATNLASSNPPPLFGSRPRRFVNGFQGPLFSQVTLEYTPWLSIRYRLPNTTSSQPESAIQATVLAGPLPPSVDLASRFRTGWSKTKWSVDENGFLPVEVSYNSSHGVGDWNSRPLVSRSWIAEIQGRRLTAFSVDPRAVVSKESGQMDVFWHRRNNFTPDYWKQGEDLSSVVSSIWLSLGQNTDEEEFQSRRLGTQLANDMVMLAIPEESKQQTKIHWDSHPPNTLESSLHSVTLRLSQVDPKVDPERQEAWIDVQIENLLTQSTKEVDLATAFMNSSKIFAQAATLHLLTYLTPVESRNGLRRRGSSDGCLLDTRDGGKSIILSVGARRICSVRIPVSPVREDHLKQQR